MPAANDDPILDGILAKRKHKSAAVVGLNAETRPDEYAERMSLAQDAGTSPAIVGIDAARFRQQRERKELDALNESSPLLAAWLTKEPDNYPLAKDDVPALTKLAQAITYPGYSGETLPDLAKGFRGGVWQVGAAAAGGLSAMPAQQARRKVRVAASLLDRFGLGDDYRQAAEAGLAPWEGLEEVGASVSAHIKGVMEREGPSRQTFGTDVAGALGQISAYVGASMLHPQAALVLGAAQGADIQGDRAREAGVYGTAEGDNAAALGALITSVTERLGVAWLLRKLPEPAKARLRSRVADILMSGAGEAGQEITEGVLQNAVTQALIDEEQTLFEGAAHEGATAGVAAAIFRMALGVRRAGDDRLSSAAQGAEDARRLGDIVEAAKAAKLGQRAPGKLEALVGDMADETVYVPASALRTLYQGDAAQFVAQLTGEPEALALAGEYGDVAIPMAKWVAAISPMDNAEEWVRNSRTDPEGLTAAEIEATDWDAELGMDEAAERAEPTEGPNARDRIQQDVFGMLHSSGRYRDTDAELQAKLVAMRYATLGDRLGVDPWEVYSRHKLRIGNGEAAQPGLFQKMLDGAKRLFQPAFHGTPHNVDRFSLDKIGTGEGAQAFGHGLYFAGRKEVASHYRKSTSSQEFTRRAHDAYDEFSDPDEAIAALQEQGLNDDQLSLLQSLQADDWLGFDYPHQAIQAALRRDPGFDYSPETQEAVARMGRLYQVEVPEDADLLNFDKPLSEQDVASRIPPNVARDIRDMWEQETGQPWGGENFYDQTGGQLYATLSDALGGAQQASEYLLGLGIPGLRYLDGSSRADWQITPPTGTAAGDWMVKDASRPDSKGLHFATQAEAEAALTEKRAEKAHNYVVWDEGAIQITDTLFQSPATGPQNGVEFTHAEENLQSRLVQWSASLHLGGSGPRAVAANAESIGAVTRNADGAAEQGDQSREALREQSARLIERAKAEGFFWGDDSPIIAALNDLPAGLKGGGAEHLAFIVGEGENRFVIRATDNGYFGPRSDISPAQYLARLEDYSRTFPVLQTRLIGVSESPEIEGHAVVWTAQPFAFGKKSAHQGALAEAMAAHGWKQDGPHSYRFVHEATGTVIEDAHTENVFQDDQGNLYPFDVVVTALPRILEQADGAPRGQMSMGPGGISIDLLANADRSTFLHELGHLFLEDLAEFAGENAEIGADFDTLLQWGGIAGETAEARLATWQGMDLDAQRELHEAFAENFEQYLLEGNAPSPELRGMFGRFRAWLRSLYGEMRKARIPLTDDVRAVMDRMLASDEEIEAAQVRQGFVPLFDRSQASKLGLTDKQFEAYAASLEAATEEARQEVFAKLYRAHQREAEAWWKEEVAALRDDVIAEFEALPAVKAWRVLSGRGPEGSPALKLDRDAVYALLPERAAWIKARILPLGVYSREGGVHPDAAAAVLGFRSGAELLDALGGIPPNNRARAERFEAEAKDRMRGKHPDPMMDGSMPEAAQDAVHKNKRVQALENELGLLAKLAGAPAPSARVLNEVARRAVGKKSLRKLRPNEALAAERKAAREAMKAAAKGDYAAALQAKREQVLQAAMYRAARDAQEDSDRYAKHLQRATTDKARAKLGLAGESYLDQADAILDRFDFRKMTGKAADRRAAFADWIRQQREAGLVLDLPPKMVNEAFRKPWRELTVDELAEVYKAIKQIEHLADTKNKMLNAQDARTFDEAADGIANGIGENHDIEGQPFDMAPSFIKRFGEALSNANAWLTKPEFLFRWLDGENAGGTVWKTLFQPFVDAEFAKQQRMNELSSKLRDIFSKYDRGALATEKLYVPESRTRLFSGNFTRSGLLAFGLNWGNAYNRDALLEGYGMTPEQGLAAMARLTNADLDTLQQVWDLVDSFWPEIASLQKRLTGLAPDKVQADSFTLPNGRVLRGGYYPLKAETKLSWRAQKRDEKASIEDAYGGAWIKAQTRHGHTNNRTNFGGQAVKLDLSVLTEHLSNVVHDLTHRIPVLDAARLLDDRRVRSAIENAAGRTAYQQTQAWLRAIAGSEVAPPTSYVDALLRRARQGATVAYMGLKVTTAIVQPLGYTQTIDVVGEKYAALGMKEFLTNGIERTRFAMAHSKVLPNRQRTFDRDVNDTLKRMTAGSRIEDAHRMYFYFIGMMDMSVSVPSWLAGYRKAFEGAVEGIDAGNADDAIAYADSVIRMSQSSGSTKDLAAIQRGGEGLRIFTMFYSYFNVLYNLVQRRVKNTKSTKDVPRLAAGMMWLWFAPAILSELVAARGPGDDDDWEEWFKEKGFMFATYPAQTVPVVRDVISGLEGRWGYSPSPAFDAFESTVKTAGILFKAIDPDQDVTRADVKAAVMTAAYWGRFPGAQAWITGEYMYDVAIGEEQPETVIELVDGVAFSRPANERN